MNRTRKNNAKGTPAGPDETRGVWQSLLGLVRLRSDGLVQSITLERAGSLHES
jgi:hypothetical protein